MDPNRATLYRDNVAMLKASLNVPAITAEATSSLRPLIAKVALTPDADAPDGLRAELHGDPAMILSYRRPHRRRANWRVPVLRRAPEHLFLGVYCRWLQGPATPFVELGFPPSHDDNTG
jgi:hypothetical protein